jgi:hypothetical protein
VQADIADQVADALDLALGTGQQQTLTERPRRISRLTMRS